MGLASFIARCLYLVGVSSSSSIPDKDFEEKWARIKGAVTLGIALQFLVLPLVGWSVVRVLHLDVVTAKSVLYSVTSPGHFFSLLWCSLFNADLLLTMVMTGLTNLGNAFLPALVWLFQTSAMYRPRTIWAGLFFPLVFTVLGLYLRDERMFYMVPDLSTIDKKLSGIAMMNTLWICVGAIGSIFTSGIISDSLPVHRKQLAHVVGILASLYFVDCHVRNYMMYFMPVPSFMSKNEPWLGSIWRQEPTTYLCIVLVVVLRMLTTIAFVSTTNLTRPEKVAFVIQMCWQNEACAEESAIHAFGGMDGTGSFLGIQRFYGFCQIVTLAIYCWSCSKLGWTKAPVHEPLSKIIWTTYTYEIQPNERSSTGTRNIQFGNGEGNVEFDNSEVNRTRED